MKYIDEFRNKKRIKETVDKINNFGLKEEVNIMEVCGTHTQNFFRFGLDRLLPPYLKFIAGPGCPVCVSSQEYIDTAIELAKNKEVVIATFGDMLRVPGTRSSLENERAKGAQIRVVYSPLDALLLARRIPEKKIVFLAVGFETTAPAIALTILAAKRERLKNIFFHTCLKLIPAAMNYLLQDKRLNLHGFLCPGHVSAIIGTKPYAFIAKRYKIGCCVAGFEPQDILEGIYLLLRQIVKGKPCVENQYCRLVKKEGNPRARKIILEAFSVSSASWRGLGKIPGSGLVLRKEFSQFDAEKYFSIRNTPYAVGRRQIKCRCGDVLKGLISPAQCILFSRACNPEHPVGPCMVSREGACNAYYRYRK